jgi:uncharacterized protein (TIGR02453 family)
MGSSTSSAPDKSAADQFTGFPPAALEFYDGLEENNSRAYWLANKMTFEHAIREPMLALLAGLPDTYGPFHMFRPNRDVRFSADKSPYKTAQGAVSEATAGGTYYVQLSSAGLLVASGMYMMAPDQLARFRAAVAEDRSGDELEQVINTLKRAKIAVEAGHDEPLKTAPRGYPKDHPRIERLRWKACMASTEITSPSVLGSRRLRDRAAAFFERTAPLVAWLERHVGPTALPRERR